MPVAGSTSTEEGKLTQSVEREEYIGEEKKINVHFFKWPALYYSKPEKTDESNALSDGGRL